MLRLPVWVPLVVGLLVTLFGLYRIRIGFRSDADNTRARERGGLYAMGRRRHLLLGVIYVLMGGMLIATAFGVKIF
jgi:hypothetical protein